MFVKKLLVATVLLSSQVYAQSTIEASLGDWSSQLMEYTQKHFSASYHGEIYGVRRDTESEDTNNKKVKDFRIMHNPTLIYKPTDNWQGLATAEFNFSDQPKESAGAAYPNGFYRGLLTLTRKNILTEKEHGIKLDAGLGKRQYNTGSAQQAGGDYELASKGNNRVFSTLSKKIGTTDTSLFLQFLNNDFKKASKTTWKNALEVIPTINIPITDRLTYLFNDDVLINAAKFDNTERKLSVVHDMNLAVFTFQWNDKVSTYFQLKYAHVENFTLDSKAKVDSLSHFVGVGYAFNPKDSITLEAGSELAHARDGRDVFSKQIIYPELAAYLDFAI